METKILSHKQLRVYQHAMDLAMEIYFLSKSFPSEELYSLTSQVRRSSRSVCANITEAWRKRRYEKSFVAKLSDAETEAAETQTWIEFASKLGLISAEVESRLDNSYEHLLAQLVLMIENPKKWSYDPKKN